ncbi:MAG: hypothetical protein Q9219_004482 [cf. Caloplaca sp. 3 TL-2023]
MASQQPEPIAIVGSGCRFPGSATSPAALWELLRNPRDVSQDIPLDRFDARSLYHPDGTHHGTTNVRQAYLLQEDIRRFDAAFFGISPAEADSMDPQQRQLLETVYEALEAGGHSIESLRGSDTAVFVGTMTADYNDALLRDLNTIPTYFGTGTSRAIISNRISYCFDWHGPSMTIDTACSSSLIAVHQGVHTLRTGESRVVLACGTQAVLEPDADGYARGEGTAAIVLKRLSDAVADGDHIECLIRGTGANQDGHSAGLTVPSSDAQAALIRQTYSRAGLDPKNPFHRPQFFEAHGTGTKAGDPKEAAAIQSCFGSRGDNDAPLYVGSIKTVIGHTEGAAGLAGLLKGACIIQKGFIPPNLLLNRLSPAVEPYYQGLQIPTVQVPWPKLPPGTPRRVSVNSFGFGGSNAHAILEEYCDATPILASESELSCTPFVFSAMSEQSLIDQLQAYSKHLKMSSDINPSDLSWTLQARRSHFPIKVAFSAATIEHLTSKIDEKLAEVKQDPGVDMGIRQSSKVVTPRVLGIFTGQGAQWAAMGERLIRSSEFVRKRVEDLEKSLATLPTSDRPHWKLQEEILARDNKSRMAEAELSQPLSGIRFSSVVGHSSGEIAAAYAAGFFSGHDAIRIAYYRGLFARRAGSPSSGQKGAMLAVGTSLEDARDLCRLKAFKGRLVIAAHNSSASVTLSGDIDAIILAKKVFDEEKKFARLLKVDTAYHSHHMLPCGDTYIRSLQECKIQLIQEQKSSWFSSVTPSAKAMDPFEGLRDVYWRDNMTNAVLFADAIRHAVENDRQLNLAIEIGPHPALRGPALQNISEVRSAALPYWGTLSRGKDDVLAISETLGFAWTHLGNQGVDMEKYVLVMSGYQPKLVTGLPSYRFNHSRIHWHENRSSRKKRVPQQAFHELLGFPSPNSTAHDMRWTNILKVSEIPWLEGHRLQGQIIFPAAGYVALAIEAARCLAADRTVELFELANLSILKAVMLDDDAVEIFVTLSAITTSESTAIAEFSCHSCPVTGSDQAMELKSKGTIKIMFGPSKNEALPSTPISVSNMFTVDTDRFYSSVHQIGYEYTGAFRGMSSMKRKLNQASALVSTYPYTDADTTRYLVHPTYLDVAFQTSMLAYSAPGDERLWALHVPTLVESIRINPELCASLPTSTCQLPVCAVLEPDSLCASIDVFNQKGQQAMIQIEGLVLQPFAPATAMDDRQLFSYTQWGLASPDGASIIRGIRPVEGQVELASVLERMSYHYLRTWKSDLTEDEWVNGQSHHPYLRDYMNHTLSAISRGRLPWLKKEWEGDTPEDIEALTIRYSDNVDIRLLSAVGKNIPAAVRRQTTILEHVLPNNMLENFHQKGLASGTYNPLLAKMIKQMTYRYPHARMLELGAGAGGATKSILECLDKSWTSYAYTDISASSFEKAADIFKAYQDRMTFQVLDIEKAPASQGFEPHSYDIVIASNVLHATSSMQITLENTRQLLKPGGRLFMFEVTNNSPLHYNCIMGSFPDWWVGVGDGRKYSPTMSPGEWHVALRKAGFSGVDAITPEIDALTWPASIISTQAVNDQVLFLRRPLHTSTSIFIENLVLLGTRSLDSARIGEALEEQLGRFCGQIKALPGLPTEEETLSLSPMSTFINLVDLESPIFKDITAEKMDGLKRVFELAKHVLWVTVGAEADEPYHQASITFSRTVAREAGHVSLNHLDFSDLGDNVSQKIAEHLLRQCALDEWAAPELLWSKEPEVFMASGQQMVPRTVANIAQDDRLHSSRRAVTKRVSLETSDVSISPQSLIEKSLPVSDTQNLVRIESSTLVALHVANGTFLYLGAGKDVTTKEPVVVLSTANSCRVNPVARLGVEFSHPTDNLLIGVASELLAGSLLENLPSQSSILAHCSSKDRFFASALTRQAAAKAIHVTLTCNEDDSSGLPMVKLDARVSKHVLRKRLLPANPTIFFSLNAQTRTQSKDLSLRIASILPGTCKQIDQSNFFSDQALLPTLSADECLVKRLEDAVAGAKTFTAFDQCDDLIIQLDQIHDSISNHVTSVVRWPTKGDVSIKVRPLDIKELFSRNKTYLLVGMTGDLGRSTCEWMVSQGAGCVCLTSRDPVINKEWLESFQGTNATIKVLAMDVINKSSVEKVVNQIRSSCPPISGVINGAMVLRDSLFSNMSLDAMQQVLRPKIDGTNNLDEIFFEDDLDFFMLLSSAASVAGNVGQAAYTAANGYMNSFARKRRGRGLAASTVDIGQVVGIGYVENASQAVKDQLTKLGMMSISEPEYHQMLAETIKAGRSSISETAVTTGIRIYRDDEDIQGPWFQNPRFSHRVAKIRSAEFRTEDSSKKTTLPVSGQLSRATSQDQVLGILMESFSSKLRIILQIRDSNIEPDTPLVELGVDSLVAVEVRTWFLKELKVDIPVLKMMGGASILELCQIALDKLPHNLPAGGSESTEPPTKPRVDQSRTPDGDSASTSSPTPDDESAMSGSSTHLTAASSILDSQADIIKPSWQSPIASSRDRPFKIVKSERMSYGQSRFWFLRLLLEDPTTFNVAFYYRITGSLRVGDLERAIRMVAARHEALRTCFVEDETEADQAHQKIMSNSTLRLEHKNIQSIEDVDIEYNKFKAHVFDLRNGDVMRTLLLSLSPSAHYLLINYHHIVMDGISLQVFISDLEKAYLGQSLGQTPRQYPDFSAAQRQAFESGGMNDELKFWRSVFPIGKELPVLPLLPIARIHSRVVMKEFDVHQVICRLDSQLARRIKSVSRTQRSTPFHFYLAAFKAMLFCFTDVEELTIGVADANRNDSDVMSSVGFFLNLLTLRFCRQPDQPFNDAVVQARDMTYAALHNSRLPFDVLLSEFNIARSSTHSPFFQAFFDYRQGVQEKQAWGNCEFEFGKMHPGRTAYDITLDMTDISVDDTAVIFRTQKSLYDLDAAKLLMETYVHFLDVLSADTALALKDTPLFGKKQMERGIDVGRGPTLISDWPETLPHRIDQIAQNNQDKVALMDGLGHILTYADMTGRIEAISQALLDAGSGPGCRVLVFQQATTDWVCSMLAIMRIEGIYVPLDLRNPLQRLATVAKDCEPSAVLVDGSTEDDAKHLNVSAAVVVNVTSVTPESSSIPITARPDQPAAILYTSGSTGVPKGITVTHSGLRNEIEGYTKTWKLGAERVLQQSSFTFNHSSDQIYTGLVNGGMVYIVPWSKRGDPMEITKIIQQHSITYTKATPSEYSLWMQYGGDNLRRATSWRFAFGGGEPLSNIVTRQFADLSLPQLQLRNSYGPTEISISSTKMEVDYRDQHIDRYPCGYSLPNYATYIVDEQLRPLPPGMPGEICIGGAGVSMGYLHNKTLTDQCFVQDPFASPEYISNGWRRMYKTGDIGHLQEDGVMVFHRRIEGDAQVKIRGLRIELSDIESNIISTAQGMLKEVIVTLRDGNPDFLVAHVVFAPQHDITDKEAYLDDLLSRLPIPQYMIPIAAIPLDRLPLTNHSKIDRRAIKEMPLTKRAKENQGDGELTETMVQLKRIWQDVLGNFELGVDINPSTSFFLVGGNSLLVIRLQSRIRQIFNVAIPLVELLGANTLDRMARKVEESSVVDLIDWEAETVPPVIPSFLNGGTETQSKENMTILVTGATGYLAKYVLPQLAALSQISTIHCVAVRDKPSEVPRNLYPSPKIISYNGNLSSPLLGLSPDEFQVLSREVDVIIHMGAMRSFWDNYQVLRPSNVHPTKELVKLAAQRRIPIHYISSVGVLPWGTAAKAISAAAHTPPVDGSNGYVATRWASERVLERSSSSMNIPAFVYRFLPSKQQSPPQRLLDEVVRFVDETGMIPDFSGWDGRVDMIPAEEAARWLCDSILSKQRTDGGDNDAVATRFLHCESPFAITAAQMSTYIEEQRGDRGLQRMPGLRWFGRIKALGFDYFITSQDATVGSKAGEGNGAKFSSRR